MKRFVIIQLIVVLGIGTISNGCQVSYFSLNKKLSDYSLGSLLILAYLVRNASAAGGAMASGIIRYPRVSLVCAAGIVVSIPPVRKALVDTGYNGVSTLYSKIINWICHLFSSCFLGGVNNKLDQTNETLDFHTAQLNTIQNIVQQVEGRINTVSETLTAAERRLRTIANDVAQVHQTVDESHTLMQVVHEENQSHGKELGIIHARCDEVNTILTNFHAQLAQLSASMETFNTSEEKVRSAVMEMRQQIDRNATILSALSKQLIDIQQSIPSQVSSINDRLGSIENNQRLQNQTINAFNAVLQQILQHVSQRQQPNAHKDSVAGSTWLQSILPVAGPAHS